MITASWAWRAAWSAILSAAVLTTAAGPASAANTALTPVSLRMDVFFYGAQAPLLLGIVDGIYKKYGLDVTASTGRGSATTIQTVANGSDQFGYADGATLARLAAQGLKAKAVLGMIETSPIAVLTLPGSGILKPKDLDGKTTAFAPGSATQQLFPAFAKRAGVDLKSIHTIAVDVSTRDSMFLLKKTDFDVSVTVAQVPMLEERCGCKLHLMRFANYGLTMMSNSIIVSDALIAQKPDLVRRFVAATVQSIKIAVKHPAHAVDDFLEYAKKSGLSRQVVAAQWREAIPLLHSPETKHKPIGYMDARDWQNTINLLTEYTNLRKGSVTPAMVYTNAFLPK